MHSALTRRRLLGAAVGSIAVVGTGSASGDGRGRRHSERLDRAVRAQVDERYTEIYDETIDAVVLVNVFGDEIPAGLGSGFVVDDYVVTNDHVAGDASEVELQFRDEQWRSASVIGSDVHSDLAVLEVDDVPEAASALSFTDAEPTVGQEVLALGNPLGLDASISQGLVSGIDRSLPSPTGFSIPAAIQTDAPVNPGNSGGPLVDLEGDVLGVVFAGAGQTIGFAISAALANRIVPALAEDGEYEHAYLGVSVVPVGPLLAEANDLEESRGVLVADVSSDAPAEGVLEPADDVESIDGDPVPVGGDVIIEIDGEEIPNQERLSSVLALETSPGDVVEIEVVREDERETVELTLEPRPDVDLP
ncbi:S1C family serine protease [Natronococcus sp.]|uniref:S1C family serine protease n=1 Tax=Natronococcus sp. TaxID=35747 RepID=UPI0025D6B2AF|nr:trypsin-like peptidase domain-containing protein [Natronococcus sp.]